ncbi:hypothetical protein ACTFIB_10790 [Staphylococcus chromogenes]|uniref:hypothetical protein n=1 Tax=Staphylococcus chromogenes TaxID=46126 RepID=UPI003EBE1786
MSLNLFTKLAMVGVVLTGITGTATLGSVAGVNHEAKAEESNPNSAHFHKTVDGQKLDFTDTFKKTKLTPKSLTEEVKQKLEEKGLDPAKYLMKLQVKGKIQGPSGGGKIVGNEHINTQLTEFNPTKDIIEEFDIVPEN